MLTLFVIHAWFQTLHNGIQSRRPDINKVIQDGQDLLKQCTGKNLNSITLFSLLPMTRET